MRHLLSSPRLTSSHARWTVTMTSLDHHDDVTATKYSFLMKPLFWVSAVCLFIAVVATAVIAIVCCRQSKSEETPPSPVQHQDTVFIEGGLPELSFKGSMRTFRLSEQTQFYCSNK